MKIRTDFVTNSSSTSFLIAYKHEFSKDIFLKSIGISLDSPIITIFENLYKAINERGTELQYIDDILCEKDSNIEIELEEHLLQKAITKSKEGYNIMHGYFDSDGTLFEVFLCTDCFEVISDTLYIDAFDCYW